MTRVYIKELNIISFGKFENKNIKFDKGFNLVFGKNESGKSTLASFVEGLLYGFDEGKSKRNFSYKKEAYKPIASYKYAGWGIFNKNGTDFKVLRNFEDGSYSIVNLSSGDEVESKSSNLNFPGEYILNIDYDIYKNYVSSFQNQVSDSNANKKLIEKLANKDIDYDFSINKSLQILDKEYNRLGSSRAYTKPYLKTKTEIEELEENLYEIRLLKKNYIKDFKRLDSNKEKLREYQDKYNKLKTLTNSFKSYRATSNYRDYKKWTDELYKINEKLADYQDVQGLNDEYFDNLEENLNSIRKTDENLLKYLLFALLVICIILGYLLNKYFYLGALLILSVFLVVNKNSKNEIGLNELNQYSKKKSRYLRYKNLLKEKEKIEEVLSILKKQDIKDEGLDIDDEDFDDFDIEKSENDLDQLRLKIDKINKEIQIDEKNLVSIEEKIKNEVDLVDRINYLKKKLDAISKKKTAIKLAKKTIYEISEENKGDYSKLNFRLNNIIREVSKNSYESIGLDDNLNPEIVTTEGYKLSLDQLSKGFIDQLYFALKLSLNEEVFSKIFMVYDDAFINYDLERLRNALFFLLDASTFRQVIYFSCHTREIEVFKSEGIDINYINMEDVWYMQ